MKHLEELEPIEQNDQRAAWAREALAAYRKARNGSDADDPFELRDLLCDLMHHADRHADDFECELDAARNSYCDELAFALVTGAQS